MAGYAASKHATTTAVTAAAARMPRPCIAKMEPIKAPREEVVLYSDIIVALEKTEIRVLSHSLGVYSQP